jgi:hypothetical protein
VSTPSTNYGTSNVTAVASRALILSVDRIPTTTATSNTHRLPDQGKALPVQVQNAMRALREMPPYAREREIETGRYSHFPPEQRDILRNLQ